jgi:cystathionine beta-lyase
MCPQSFKPAHARGVAVALDNTYAAGVMFDAFAHGVDVKHAGAHKIRWRSQ